MRKVIRMKSEMNRSKYQSFIEVNPSLTRPSVYNHYIPTHKLLCLTRLRSISHNLAIETGRHSKRKVEREHRLCTCGEIEDEKHFIMRCHQYSHIRNKYFTRFTPFHEMLDTYHSPNFVHELMQCRDVYM